MLAGFAEEIGQIHAPAAVRFRRKAYGADKSLIVPEKRRIVKEGTMHAAQIDEIQRCPPQHEQRFYPIAVIQRLSLYRGKIADDSAPVAHTELADPGQDAVDCCALRHAVGIVLNAAPGADCLLLDFCLNRKNLQHIQPFLSYSCFCRFSFSRAGA